MTNKEKVVKDVFLVIVSNIITLISSVLLTAIVPKFLGVLEFSYWQLYMFYSTYIIYFQLGWLEGIYLKEGGKEFTSIYGLRYKFQRRLLFAFGLMVSCIILVISQVIIDDKTKNRIIAYVCIYFVIVLIRTFYSYIYQATGRIRIYVIMNVIERLSFFLGCIILLWIGVDRHEHIIQIDLLCRAVSVLIAVLYGKELFRSKGKIDYKREFFEVIDDVKIGSKLMLASATGLLVNGVVRFIVESHWDVETFGRVSLSINLSNFVIVFIGAISVVFFPILRRIEDGKKHRSLYDYLSTIIQVFTFGAMCFYYPVKMALSLWLPDYLTSIEYLAILFPLCYFESKLSVVNVTYLKAYREESSILRVNIIALCFSVFLSLISIVILDNLTLGIFVILLCSMVKCIVSSFVLYTKYGMGVKANELFPIIVSVCFVVSNMMIGGMIGFVVYFAILLIYGAIKYKDIKSCFLFLASIRE